MRCDALTAISIRPDPALREKPADIRLLGLTPRQRWHSCAESEADAVGVVRVSAAVLSGSYSGVNAMDLFWRVERPDGGAPVPFARTTSNPLMGAFMAEADGREVATTHHTRQGMAAWVRRMEVRDHGLVGTLWLLLDHGPHPGIIVLGGSGGGIRELLMALLASHSCAAQALAYFGAEGLPPQVVANQGHAAITVTEVVQAASSLSM
jgi:hypothetical protein